MSIPKTVWVPQPQTLVGEFTLGSAFDLADPTDSTILIADPTDSLIIIASTDSTFTPIDPTIWVVDDNNE